MWKKISKADLRYQPTDLKTLWTPRREMQEASKETANLINNVSQLLKHNCNEVLNKEVTFKK